MTFDFREPVNTWTHVIGLLLAMVAIPFLWRRGRATRAERFCLLVYGLGLVACYAASSLYHGAWGTEAQIAALARLDHVGIFLLIAGTYTPLAWGLMRGWKRAATLVSVWLISISTAIVLAAGIELPRPVATGLFLGLGWGSVACVTEIVRVVPLRSLLLLLVGGLCYSVGAVFNLLRWPVLWPGAFAAHELFHLFVIAGSFAHFWFILKVVVPSHARPHIVGRRARSGSEPRDSARTAAI